VLVFWNERLVLLAVPKTGTTALEGALAPRAAMVLRDPPRLKHVPLYRFRRLVLPLLEAAGGTGWETVAAVREPVDWLASWWRYRGRDEIATSRNSTRGASFEEFVRDYARERPPPRAAVGSQARFVGDGKGAVEVDHLFRYEEFERLTGFLEARLGALPRLGRLNVSPPGAAELSAEGLAALRAARPAEFAVWAAAGSSAPK
jgi:hypothetical protein